mgnify:CR=1 FL=1
MIYNVLCGGESIHYSRVAFDYSFVRVGTQKEEEEMVYRM